MPRTIGGLMEDLISNGWSRINEEVSSFNAPVNIQETETSYELHLVAPGLKKEDFKINLDRNVLTLSYDHKEENKEQDGKWLRSEFNRNSFKRSFTLNEKIDGSKINAKYADGILLVTLPKKEPTEHVAQEITVN